MSSLRAKWRDFHIQNKKSNGYLLRKQMRNVGYKFARALLLFGLCFLILQPLLNKLSLSFMKERDLYDPTIIAVPRNFTLENYHLVSELMGFWTALWNSTGVSLIGSVLQVLFCTVIGYGFARFEFPLKKLWFACVILVIIVPPQTIMSSLYLNFSYFDVFGIIKLTTGSTVNLLSTPVPYLLLSMTGMGLKNGLYIFLIRQYFRGIPKEMEEAAYVDGCGNFATFARIMVPGAKPILISCFLFAFVWQWTDSFYTKMFLGRTTLLSGRLMAISGQLNEYLASIYGTGTKATIAYDQMMISTGLIMAIIPLLLIYVVAQKGFVESLSQTGIKM